MQNKVLFLLGVLLLIGVGCVSAETQNGTFVLDSQLTWYFCSAANSTYIYYDVATTATGTPVNNFGTINAGSNYTDISSITEGFVTLLTTRTGVRDFLNPSVPNIVYNASLSCSDATVKTCEKGGTVTKESWCLIVYNPITPQKLLLNVVFSTDQTNNTTVTSTTASTSPTSTPSSQHSAGQKSFGVETTVVSAIVGLMVAGFLVAWV